MAVLNFDEKSFKSEVAEGKGLAVVDFWAPWCGPCQIMGPILVEFEKELGEKVKVGKINVDEVGAVAQQFGVMSIPTLIIFKDGKNVKQFVGVQGKESLLAEVEGLLK